jgi:2'-deoxynucleoside 5'-phosphate N-hydrolase
MKIYFAGSISAGREDAPFYLEIIKILKMYGEVLTEHIGGSELSSLGEVELSDKEIHDRDMNWLLSSDLIVAEVTNPSLGVGYEIGRAIENGKKVICLFRKQKNKRLSAMVFGSKDLICESYTDIEEVKEIIKKYLE